MKNLLSALCFVALAVTACAPRDVPLEEGGNRGNGNGNSSGASVGTFSEKGTRADCPATASDYRYVMNTLEKPEMLTGEVIAYMQAGSRNCLKIGSTVDLVNPTNSDRGNAKVVIVKVDIARANAITKAQATALGYPTAKEAIAAAEAMNAAATKFDPKGLVSITYFDVDGGQSSSTGTDTPVTPTTPATGENGELTSLPAILTFATEGELASTCTSGKSYTYLYNPTEYDAAILEGKVNAALTVGDRNCYRVGTVLPLQNATSAEVRAQLYITQVQIVHYNKLGEYHARALGMTLEQLKAYARTNIDSAKAAGKFDPREMVSVTFFEVISGAAPTTDVPVVDNKAVSTQTNTTAQSPQIITPVPATAPVAPETIMFTTEGQRANCPEKNKDFTYLYSLMENDEKLKSKDVTAVLAAGDRSCYRIGSVIALQNGTSAKVRGQVKILKAEISHISKLTEDQAKAMGMTLDELKAYAQAQIDRAVAGGKFDPKNMVNFVYFEVQSWVEQAAAPAPAAL